jgi:hypothetical protein
VTGRRRGWKPAIASGWDTRSSRCPTFKFPELAPPDDGGAFSFMDFPRVVGYAGFSNLLETYDGARHGEVVQFAKRDMGSSNLRTAARTSSFTSLRLREPVFLAWTKGRQSSSKRSPIEARPRRKISRSSAKGQQFDAIGVDAAAPARHADLGAMGCLSWCLQYHKLGPASAGLFVSSPSKERAPPARRRLW